jgi:hypothetical protein
MTSAFDEKWRPFICFLGHNLEVLPKHCQTKWGHILEVVPMKHCHTTWFYNLEYDPPKHFRLHGGITYNLFNQNTVKLHGILS